MIIYGTGEKRHQDSEMRKLICPDCGQKGIVIHLFHKYVHLFWIPTFPYSKRTVAVCEVCNSTYQDKSIPETLKLGITEIKHTLKPPRHLYSGLLLVLAGFVVIYYLSTGPKTYKYPSGNKQARGKMIGSDLHGKWTFWYENGNVSAIQFFNKGIEDSTWTWWNEDGSVNKMGSFKNGMYHGKWTHYYPDGKLSAEENYVNSRPHYGATYWHENGNISAKGEYNRGLRDGLWTYWYESGTKSEEGWYSLDKRTGDWQSYYENGNIALHTHYTDSATLFMNYWDANGVQLIKNGEGEYITYYDNGQIASRGKLSGGITVGVWNFWHPNGALKETGRYDNNIYRLVNAWDSDGNTMIANGNGYYINKYENGVVASEGNYLNGLEDGEWKIRNEFDIIVHEITYSSGKASGNSIVYYDSGEKKSEGKLLNNNQQGKWTWYFSSGTVETQTNFVDGLKEGEQIFWNESGKVVKKEFYEKGKLVNEESYYN